MLLLAQWHLDSAQPGRRRHGYRARQRRARRHRPRTRDQANMSWNVVETDPLTWLDLPTGKSL
jgi:hypothetical protein